MFPGVSTKVYVEIQNNSTKEIKKMKLSVVSVKRYKDMLFIFVIDQIARIKAVARGHHMMGDKQIVQTSGNFYPILPGATKRTEFDVELPPNSGKQHNNIVSAQQLKQCC